MKNKVAKPWARRIERNQIRSAATLRESLTNSVSFKVMNNSLRHFTVHPALPSFCYCL